MAMNRLKSPLRSLPWLVLGVLLLRGPLLWGQANFQPGYLLSLQGDTLRGQIDYQEWDRNPRSIRFRAGSAGETRYGPSDIAGFGVMGDVYHSRMAEIDVTPRNDDELKYDAERDLVMDTVFLQVLVKGPAVTLYYLLDERLKTHFFIAKDSLFRELVYHRWAKGSKGARRLREKHEYRGQLGFLLNECPDLVSRIARLDYELKLMLRLVQDYYACRELTPTYVKQYQKVALAYGVMAGATLTQMRLISGFSDFNEAAFEGSFAPTFGVSLNVIPPRARGRFSAYVDLIYHTMAFFSS